MEKHNSILSLLKNTGLIFEDNGNYFSSRWKIHTTHEIKVIVAYDIHPDWVHVLCNVGYVHDFTEYAVPILLRLNNKIAGSKFSLDQSEIIVCSSEIFSASEEELKQRIAQVVKMVSLFYECVEKENLKLNST